VASYDLIVVGGGLTSARALRSYREAGGAGSVALFTRDDHVPYHRPPLSKRYLRGEAELESTFVEPPAWYEEQAVEVHLETPVGRVDPDAHEIELESGERHGYGQLLVATGAWPRRLQVPGAELEGVTTFRTLDNSTRLRAAATAGAERALVVGGSFIACEIAASLRVLGVEVTLVHRGSGLFDVLQAPEVSAELDEIYRAEGVELIYGDEVSEFRGNGRLAGVETRESRSVDVNLAVVGIGVVPVLELLEGSGIETGNGVKVDERYRTSAPDVFAAGDNAEFPDTIFGRRRRIEHWSNANYQGTEVGKVLAGAEGGYDVVSSFFTEVFGFSLKVFGDLEGHDEYRLEGSVKERSAVGLYLSGGRLVAALSIGQDEATETELMEAIASHAVPPRLA
jgi:3-phenylpropionate/trans-cinnamate dioxygenase ferredoxin reductase subunit